ncbi:MAG: hypothetical protein COB09_11340 [Thalassobium sp.]|nr:MAG: hypothetical protein COB09_11340 [Thalassobium sp.]
MPPEPADDTDIAGLIAYLNMQYQFRAYVGTYELPWEMKSAFVLWDEVRLVPVIDAYLADSDSGRYGRWKFLKSSFMDMNSGSATLATVSGKPYAPVAMDFHARALISDLLLQDD